MPKSKKLDSDLEELEKKSWALYFQDGLLDIFIGIVLITSAIRAFTNNVWFMFLLFAGMFIMIIGKRYITTPRIGKVKFGPIRIKKRIKLLSMIGFAIIITLMLILPDEKLKELPEYISSMVVAIVIFMIFGAMAYYLEYWLFGVYGLLFTIGELLWGWFGDFIGPLALLIFGIFILIIGVVTLFKFMQKYQLPYSNKEVISGS